MARTSWLLLTVLVAAACTAPNPSYRPPGSSDALVDGYVSRDIWISHDLPRPDMGRPDRGVFPSTPDGVDILLVVDNSGGMIYPQKFLAQSMPALLSGLGKLPGGANYRVGLVTTDMGVGAFSNSNCSKVGDAGELQLPGSCPKPKGGQRWVQVVGGTSNVQGDPAAVVACMVDAVNAGGCGFEQPLKAMRTALSGVNPGFPRKHAALAVVILTNEDDCSAASNTLFDAGDSSLGPYSSYRCFQYGVLCSGKKPPLQATLLANCAPGQSWLHGVNTTYASFLKSLKPPGWVSVLVLASTPDNTTQVVKEKYGSKGYYVMPSCQLGGYVQGTPAFRLDSFVGAMGSRGVFSTICSTSYAKALSSLLLRIQSAF